MSIKSDKWIRRMSEEHGMIEPFEPNQIKQLNGEKLYRMVLPAMVTIFAAHVNSKFLLISTLPLLIRKILIHVIL